MLAHLEFWILEAAFRSLLMALAVWGGICIFRVQAVLAQKLAWVLVLGAAGAMPLVMHLPWLSMDRAILIPVGDLSRSITHGATRSAQPAALPSQRPAPLANAIPKRLVLLQMRNAQRHSQVRIVRSRGPAIVGSMISRAAVALQRQDGEHPQPIAVLSPVKANAPESLTSRRSLAAYIPSMLEAVYGAIALLLLLRTFAGLGMAFRIWRRSRPIAHPFDTLEEILTASQTDALRIRVSSDLATPVTIGSTVILPANCTGWDEAKLRIVLAHEREHVRQRDFYLQAIAAIHAAIFWFSPMGWWLKRKLTELGEALSDRAGLEEASDAASYAQVLLEFAAMPRTTPFAGVAMARSSHLSSRIERILNDRRFQLAFLGGRGHAILAAALVPVAMVTVVACIRIAPAVEAAQARSAALISGQSSGAVASGQHASVAPGQASGQVSMGSPDQVTSVEPGQDVASQVAPVSPVNAVTAVVTVAPVTPLIPVVSVAHMAPVMPAVSVMPAIRVSQSADDLPSPPQAPQADAAAPQAPTPPVPPQRSWMQLGSDDGQGSFAIVDGKNGSTVNMQGSSARDLDKAKEKFHEPFILFERNGKSYVITDPAIVAQSQSLFKSGQTLQSMQAELQRKQAELNSQMAAHQQETAKVNLNSPEFREQMAKLQQELATLQTEKFKKLSEDVTKQVNEAVLADLQAKMGDIQEQIGEIQSRIGEKQSQIGEKQDELGEQMGRLGEEMGRIGEKQANDSEEATRKMQSMIDQAMKDGKAAPVD